MTSWYRVPRIVASIILVDNHLRDLSVAMFIMMRDEPEALVDGMFKEDLAGPDQL